MLAVFSTCAIIACAIPAAFAATGFEYSAAQYTVDRAISEFGVDRDSALNMIQQSVLFGGSYHYTFVADGDHTILAHSHDPSLVGKSLHDISSRGGDSMADIIENSVSPYGAWVESSPQLGLRDENSIIWIKEGWGLTFGSGIYREEVPNPVHVSERDMERQKVAQDMVEHTITSFTFDPNHTIEAIHDMSNPLYHDDEVFVFVVGRNGTVLAHGQDPALTGADIDYLAGSQGAILGDLFETNMSPHGSWFLYYWPNAQDRPSLTLVWVKSHMGLLFGAGMYPESPDHKIDPEISWYSIDRRESARMMIKAAMDAFAAGPTDAINMIHDPDNRQFHDGEMHVIVADDMMDVIAYGSTPDLVGTSLYSITGTRNANFGDMFEEASPYETWINYYAPTSNTQTDVLMSMLLRSSGGYTFGVGVYQIHPDETHAITPGKRQLQYKAQDMVELVMRSFVTDIPSTIQEINGRENSLYNDGRIYVFVAAENGTVIAHGAEPDMIGADLNYIEDSWGVNLGELFEDNLSIYGRWVDYNWPNPNAANEVQLKTTWLKYYAGYMFGVGVYELELDNRTAPTPPRSPFAR